MTEDVTIFLVGKRIATVLVLLGDKIQKCLHIFFMDKVSGFIYPEKLTEVKSHIFIHELMEQPSEVVCIDVHRGQGGVWIRITEMGQIP